MGEGFKSFYQNVLNGGCPAATQLRENMSYQLSLGENLPSVPGAAARRAESRLRSHVRSGGAQIERQIWTGWITRRRWTR